MKEYAGLIVSAITGLLAIAFLVFILQIYDSTHYGVGMCR